MEILLTGGNGFVGRHLARTLLERGDSVRALLLPGEDAGWMERRSVPVFRGDVRDVTSLAAAVEGVDAVVHLAAMMHVWRPVDDYREVNVVGTENVCRAAMAAGVHRMVHFSSSSVYGCVGPGPVGEDQPLRPLDDPYSVTKAEADELVLEWNRRHGLPAVVLRPDQIFGPGDRLHFGAIARRLAAGTGIIVGRGDNALPLVYVDDIVRAVLLSLDVPEAVGQAFNITNDEVVTQRAFLEAVAEAVGASPRWLRIPYRPLYLAAALAERIVRPNSRTRPPVTRLGVAFLGTDARFSIAKARSLLGYAPATPVPEGVQLSAEWLKEDSARTLHEAHAEPPVLSEAPA